MKTVAITRTGENVTRLHRSVSNKTLAEIRRDNDERYLHVQVLGRRERNRLAYGKG